MKHTNHTKNHILLKRILSSAFAILLLVSIIPYFVPLSKPVTHALPYDNSDTFTIDNTTIHYRTYPPQNTKYQGNVIMIHGLGGSTFSYEKSAPFLADQGYYVITLDLPGFGYSSRNPDENHAQTHRASLIWQCLDQIEDQIKQSYNITESVKWHLVGHSMGGGTVAAMAHQEPKRTQSLVFVDGALFETSRSGFTLTSVPMLLRWVQVALEHVIINEDRIRTFLESAYGQTPTTDQVEGYLNPLQLNGTARSATSLLKTAENLSESALATLKVPVLAIWGKDDQWVPFSDANRIKALMPQLKIQAIEGAGHCPMETHPDIFNNNLLAWLNLKISFGLAPTRVRPCWAHK
jgi:pimeloyl-ACP methyl ester carboxylesterase